MLTRFQRRVHVVHQVLLDFDLVIEIVVSVPGRSRFQAVWRIIPCVCQQWRQAWLWILQHRFERSTVYRFDYRLSLSVRENHLAELKKFDADLQKAAYAARMRCMNVLKCSRDGVPSLLGHTVVELACRLTPPKNDGQVPRPLFRYVTVLRIFFAELLIKHFICNPQWKCPLLPDWYVVVPHDALHIALKMAAKN